MARAVLWLAALIWLLPGHALAQRLVLSDTRVVLLEGSDVTFSVGLSTVPTDTVTVTFAVTVHSTGVAATDLTVAPATLTFTTADWGTAQEVTVSKVQRSGLTPDPTRTLTLTASGGGYSGSSTVTIGVVDTESRKLVLSPLEPKVREGGTVKQSLRLPSLPSSTVTVSVTVDNNKLTLDRSSLQFTTSDWDMSKSVLITAGQDTDKNDHSIGIVWIARGGGYNEQRSHHRTAVRVFDDDSPQVVLSTSTLGVAEGGSNTYTVRLATRPTATVTVAITGHSGTDLTLDKTSLTFNPSGPDLWSAPQTVTVSAGEDADARNDIGTLLHTASGGDYAGKTTTLPVTTTDDDFTVSIGGVPAKINSTATFTAAFTFSEDVMGFVAADVTVTGGAKGAFSGSGKSYALAVTPTGSADVVVEVAANSATDGDGNTGPAAVSATAAWDAAAPTVSIGGVPAKINSTAALTVTFAWSEDVTGFVAGDVTVTGGTKGAFAAVNGSSYTLAVTPAGGSNVTVEVAADAATDGLNTGPASVESATVAWDAAAPTVSIGAVPAKINSRTPLTVTFGWSEDVSGFAAADVTVTGGAKGAFTAANGSSYTLAVTPAGGSNVAVTVAADAATDGAGNAGPTAAVSATATWDAVAPTVSIAGVPAKINSRTPLTVTFGWSEDVSGFAAADVTVTGGAKGAFTAANGSSYTLAVTPAGGSNVAVTVAADAATDGVNTGPASAVSATATWDAVAPTVSIAGVPPKINSRTPLTVTFGWSEDVSGFAAADVTVTGGAKGAFTAANGSSYTLAVTPAGGSNVAVTVAADAATDGAGNAGPASAVSATATWDAVAPTVSIAGVPPKINSRTPLTVTFGWSEDVSGFAAADVTVTGGAKGAFTAANGSSYTLAVTPAGGSNVAVTVAADAATDGVNTGPASAVSATATWDAVAPTVSIAGVPPKINSRTPLTVTFGWSEDVSGFAAADVTVTGGAKGAFTAANGSSYTLAVTPAGGSNVAVTVAADAATDGVNTGPASAVSATATWDAAAPTVGITGVPPKINSRTALTATFAFSEDVTGFATGDITVTGGAKGTFTAVNGSSYTLAVTPTGGADVAVTVAADAATDGINAGPASAVSATAVWDASVPAVGITGVPPKINSRTVFTATFTFSEDVTEFVAADVTVTGGAKGAFTAANGSSYTLAVTPAGGSNVAVTVAADAATDGVNTGPASAVSATATWDAAAPTVGITGVPPKINSRTALTATFAFSEDVTGFATGDITVTGGAKGTFTAVNGSSYTLAVTPTGGADVAVTVAADAATDGINAGPASAVSATAVWDASVPAVGITGVPPKINSRTVFTATFTFSEDVTEFVAADVTVTGGAKGAFSGNGRSYTLAVTPAGSADAVVTVAADAATDGLNTGPASAVSATATWDAAAPTVGITGVPPKINSRTALTATFAFSEDVTGFATGDITVTGGAKGTFTAVNGSSYTLAVTPTGGADVAVTVAADAATDGINAGPASAVSATAVWDASVPAVGITGVPPKINSRTVFTATFTFSEDVTEFVAADVTVTGGAKGAFSGSGRSYTLAVTPTGGSNVTVTVAANSATDGVNTGPASAVSATATWDATAPTVTISGVPPKINSRTVFTATFAFSEDVTEFVAADVTVNGGAKGAFSGSGRSYTLAVTPTGGSNVTVTVAANSATDGVNTGPASAVSATATWDATAPTVTISGVPPKINSRTVFTATFAFSEDVTEFVAADVTVTGGAKGAFSGNGRSYTLAVTPAGSADVVVTVAADAARDGGGNTGPAAAVSATATWDATAPTVSITGVPPKIGSTAALSVTFMWSEDVTGFATGDVTVTGGAKGAFAGSGRSYTLVVTPTSGSNVAVTVAANSVTDGLNAGPASAVSATATWDAVAPTVSIAGVPPKINSRTALTAAFTWSEDVTGFVAADVTVNGGAKGAFSGSGRSYTLAVTPTGGSNVTVTVAADAATDGGSNTGPAAAVSATAAWDAATPAVSIGGVPPKINSRTVFTAAFTWSEDVTGFATGDVTVTGGAKGAFTAATASSYTLAVTPTGAADVVVTVAADSATDGVNTGPASAVSATATWDATAPTVTISGVPPKINSRTVFTATFAFSEDVTEFVAADVTVTGGAKGAFSGNGRSYTLAVTPAGSADVVVTVAADAARDGGGNTGPAAAVSATATWDATAPTVSITGVPPKIGSTAALSVTFMWSEDVTGFATGDVTVTGGAKGAFAGSGRSYTLVVTPTSGSNVAVTVAANSVTDGLNAGPASAVSATATWDAVAPTVSIAGVPPKINSRTALTAAFTWSEDVTGFVAADVTVNGGAKGAFSGSGRSYTLAVTPTGGSNVTVTVAADAATDGGSNTGPASAVSATATWDAAAPAVSIGGVPAKINSRTALTVTFGWSEDVTGFAAADVTVTGGANGAFTAVNGSSYTLAVTPTGGGADVTVTVAADAATDGLNTGPASAVSATATWDAAAPAVSIGGVPAKIGSTAALSVTFAWSEDVTGFADADVSVTGGTKGAFAGSGRSYTLVVTPTDGSNVTVEVAADAATDGLNTGPASAVSATATWNAAAPTVSIGGVPATINSTAALSVTFAWSEDVTGFATGDVAVTGGTKGAFTGSGKSYALAVTPTGSADVSVTVAANAATDGGGNTGPAAAESATATWDTPPVATVTVGDASATEGDPLTFTVTLGRAVSGDADLHRGHRDKGHRLHGERCGSRLRRRRGGDADLRGRNDRRRPGRGRRDVHGRPDGIRNDGDGCGDRHGDGDDHGRRHGIPADGEPVGRAQSGRRGRFDRGDGSPVRYAAEQRDDPVVVDAGDDRGRRLPRDGGHHDRRRRHDRDRDHRDGPGRRPGRRDVHGGAGRCAGRGGVGKSVVGRGDDSRPDAAA